MLSHPAPGLPSEAGSPVGMSVLRSWALAVARVQPSIAHVPIPDRATLAVATLDASGHVSRENSRIVCLVPGLLST